MSLLLLPLQLHVAVLEVPDVLHEDLHLSGRERPGEPVRAVTTHLDWLAKSVFNMEKSFKAVETLQAD